MGSLPGAGGAVRRADRCGRRRGPALAVLLAVLVGASLLAGFDVPARAVTPIPPNTVRVAITSITPTSLGPGQDLVVQATLTNTGPVPLTNLDSRLYSRFTPLTSRAEVRQWSAADPQLINQASLRREVPAAKVLAPRASVQVRITVLPSVLKLFADSPFGTRGLIVDAVADGQRIGSTTTFVVWNPGRNLPQPVRLTLLAPVTSTVPQADASTPDPDLVRTMAAGGRLDRLTRTIAGARMSWAVDPALLLAAQRAATGGTTGGSGPPGTSPGGTPTTPSGGTPPTATSATATPTTASPATGRATSPAVRTRTGSGTSPGPTAGSTGSAGSTSPGSTSPGSTTGNPPTVRGTSASSSGSTDPSAATARSWLGTVTRIAGTERPLALPFADPDLAALAHNDGGALLGTARAEADAVTQQVFGSSLRSSVAWPNGGRADAATIALLGGPTWQGVILAQSSLPAEQQGVTAPARASVARSGTALPAMLFDDGLSQLLAQLGARSNGLVLQRTVAELATIGTENPATARHLLAVAPRDWNPDPAAATAALGAIGRLSWVQGQSMDSLVKERPSDVRRRGLQYPRQARGQELPGGHVQEVVRTMQDLDRFRPALTAPGRVVPPLQRQVTSLVGLAWRDHVADLAAAREPVERQVQQLYAGITVLTSSQINMLSHAGQFNMTVQNDLDQPVNVLVELRPKTGRLIFRKTRPLTVPAHGHGTVKVTLRALANGDATVQALVWTWPQGDTPVAQSQSFVVRVRDNWESIGLSVVAGLLGLLVVLGLIRGIRRGRRPLPPESAPDLDEELMRQEGERHWPFRRRADRSQDDGTGSGPGSGEGGRAHPGPGAAGSGSTPGSGPDVRPGSDPDGSGDPHPSGGDGGTRSGSPATFGEGDRSGSERAGRGPFRGAS